MEIAILVCNKGVDYESALHAYSIYKYLVKQGNRVEIIDYNFLTGNKNGKNSKMLYNFLDNNIVLTLNRYEHLEQIEEKLPLADKYIIVGGESSELSINLGENTIVYYAKDIDKYNFNELNKKFKDISVSYNSNDEYKRVIDPIFLLSQSDWHSLYEANVNIEIPTNYTLVFSKNVSKDIIEYANNLSKYSQSNLYYITEKMNAIFYNGKRLRNINPIELVNLIENANDVITTEDIVIKLCTLFEKNVHIFTSGEDLQIELINDLELNSRIVKDTQSVLSNTNCKYIELGEKINKLKEDSYEFLKE